MEADEKVKLARQSIPVQRDHVYFDSGSIGPVSTIYATTLARCTDEDLGKGRALPDRYDRMAGARERIRGELASLLGTEPEQIELTRSTTDGLRTLLSRFPFSPGDEIVTTQLEFPPCADVIDELARSGRVAVRRATVPDADMGDLGWLDRCVTPKTRLIAFSGVAYTGGVRLPLERIAEYASARGIRTVVDGAQLVGAATPDMTRMRIDFLALPLQKWLCGPEGLGALYLRPEGPVSSGPERITHGWPVLEATADHLEWMRKTLGWSWIHERTMALAAYARRALSHVEQIRLATPEAHAGLVSVQCAQGASSRIQTRLKSEHMIVRHRPEIELLRISTAFFNTEQEIDRYAGIIRSYDGHRHPKYAS